MKLLTALVAMSVGTTVFAADLNGTFECDDGGTLNLKRYEIQAYSASLKYEDGDVSTLDKIVFRGESLRGTMYRDDEEAYMGTAIQSNEGKRIVLSFDSGDRVVCTR